MSPKIFNASYARAETESHQNWLLSDLPRGGAGLQVGIGGGFGRCSYEGLDLGFQRVYSGYYSEVGTMDPWEQPPLSFKLSYIIPLVIFFLSYI